MVIVATINGSRNYSSRDDSFTVKVIKKLTRIQEKTHFLRGKYLVENSRVAYYFLKLRLLKKVRYLH